jgi:hypothetical protein
MALGLGSVSSAQRALLVMRLVHCGEDTTSQDVVRSLTLSESPLQLHIDGCGGASADRCGAVVGNIVLTVAVMLFGLSAAVGIHRVRKGSGWTVHDGLAAYAVPARLVSVGTFLLQPTVGSSLGLLWYGGGVAACYVMWVCVVLLCVL